MIMYVLKIQGIFMLKIKHLLLADDQFYNVDTSDDYSSFFPRNIILNSMCKYDEMRKQKRPETLFKMLTYFTFVQKTGLKILIFNPGQSAFQYTVSQVL